MGAKGSAGTTLLTAATLLLVVLTAVVLFARILTCPGCEGRSAIVRDCQLNAGRTPAFEACAACRDRGAVTPLRRLRLR